jgi:deoxyribonuclease V
MILAFDVQYTDNQAKAVVITFQNWEDAAASETIIKHIEGVADYEPGAFYKRELPCIMAILDDMDLSKIDLIVVDSYVYLDDFGKLGLGGHLYHALGEKLPVIGVAKTKFMQNNENAVELLRGESQKPLFVTAIGFDMHEAADLVKKMHGDYRFPTLLKYLDDKTKEKK